MAFRITITREAEIQWRGLPAREQGQLRTAVESRLVQRPTVITNAVKRLRPNPFAAYELRVGDLRVLYNVEGDEIVLLAIGRKVGNKLVVGGKEFHGHKER